MLPRKIIVILGPTAAGKSSLGIRLAKRFHGIVISADSRQVYRGMDLGTGKVTRREMRGVPHFLLNVASPRGQYSVSRYYRDVRSLIKKLPLDTPIFLVGGSPFYINAITKPNSFSAVPPDPKLRRRLERLPNKELINRLAKIDPARAKIIDPANRRRLIRALEIAKSSATAVLPPMPELKVLKIGLSTPRPELFRRIDTRVDKRMKQGMLKEVAKLHRQGISWKKLDNFGLEYRYLSRHLRGQLNLVEATSQLKTATHDFARRQMTWWKKEHDIHWISQPKTAIKLITKFLEN